MSDWVLGCAAVSLFQLDAVSVGQFFLSRPWVVGPALGTLLGCPVEGMLLGAVCEIFLSDGMPLGGAIPLNGTVLCGVSVSAFAHFKTLPLGAAFLAGWVAAAAYRSAESWQRTLRARWLEEVRSGGESALNRAIGRGLLLEIGLVFSWTLAASALLGGLLFEGLSRLPSAAAWVDRPVLWAAAALGFGPLWKSLRFWGRA